MSLLRSLIFVLIALTVIPANAQVFELNAASKTVSEADSSLQSAQRSLNERLSGEAQKILRDDITAIQQSLRPVEIQLDQQLTLFDARVEGLGPVDEGVVETPEIQQERKRLTQERAEIDATLKRARLLEVEAQQYIAEIDRNQAEQLNQELSVRANSPLTPAFWTDLLSALPRDTEKVSFFVSSGIKEIHAQWKSGTVPWQLAVGILLAGILLFPVRIFARKIGQRYIIGSAPGHQIRRSLFALWKITVGTLTPLLAAFCLVQGFRWAGIFPERWDGFLDSFIASAGFGAFTASLSGAVLMRRQPSWRIAPISNNAATQLRPLTWILAIIAFSCGVIDGFHRAVGTSNTTFTAWQMTEALIHLLWLATLMVVIGRLRAKRTSDPDSEDFAPGPGMAFVTLVVWAMISGAALALVFGYIALSVFVARLIIWAAVLATTLYLLLGTADSAATLLFNRDSRLGKTLITSVGVRGSVIDQVGVLMSAAIRVTLILTTVGLLTTPFGGGGGLPSMLGWFTTISQGFEIGGVSVSPGALIRAIVVGVIGLALVRGFMGWLEKRYLPATDLDGSAQNSASLVARYVGIALVIIWALASLGIGVERIALLLSALSVGIGFGLQAITQNFVSGLILLAERPIKIGDWIRVGTDEGDVKRINVRSTEITLPDHSTLIVPNSELITKTVLNKTLAEPLGRIQIKFSVPLETSVDEVIQIVHGAFSNEPTILTEPAPAAYVDSIAESRIMFNCFAHVESPRAVYRTRSNLFLTLLRTFAANGIEIGTLPQRFEINNSPEEHTANQSEKP